MAKYQAWSGRDVGGANVPILINRLAGWLQIACEAARQHLCNSMQAGVPVLFSISEVNHSANRPLRFPDIPDCTFLACTIGPHHLCIEYFSPFRNNSADSKSISPSHRRQEHLTKADTENFRPVQCCNRWCLLKGMGFIVPLICNWNDVWTLKRTCTDLRRLYLQ